MGKFISILEGRNSHSLVNVNNLVSVRHWQFEANGQMCYYICVTDSNNKTYTIEYKSQDEMMNAFNLIENFLSENKRNNMFYLY